MCEATNIIEEPVEHHGWHVYTFEYGGYYWRLTTIDDGREAPHSLFSCQEKGNTVWPVWDTLQVSGILSVNGCLKLIDRTYRVFELGRSQGSKEKESEFRKALGL